ncbi:Putative metallopeptidase, catalytic domain superfamily [Colletotrichum destructivum]|uniref:Metallopeptidase, catalytic domain superfamily n=1 Tax=Colletotrichum destructivum TaxID=34406 RepID=A0AAX4IUS5_9PEZI|nr:Putative metallopeptidase, catalytic domain superfamily [Colletotrichum destructivum]
MLILFLLQCLLFCSQTGYAQSKLEPRKFGNFKGCSEREVAILREEMALAKQAATFAARYLTAYPYFWAFQTPEHPFFQGKNFEQAASELFARMAQSLEAGNFNIECHSDLCESFDDDDQPLASTDQPAPSQENRNPKAVMAFCEPFFDNDSQKESYEAPTRRRLEQFRGNPEDNNVVNLASLKSTKSQTILHELSHTTFVGWPVLKILSQAGRTDEWWMMSDWAYGPVDCYKLARGVFNHNQGTTPSEEDLFRGAFRAADNAESWGLIAIAMLFSNQLGNRQIPIPGIPNRAWGGN